MVRAPSTKPNSEALALSPNKGTITGVAIGASLIMASRLNTIPNLTLEAAASCSNPMFSFSDGLKKKKLNSLSYAVFHTIRDKFIEGQKKSAKE